MTQPVTTAVSRSLVRVVLAVIFFLAAIILAIFLIIHTFVSGKHEQEVTGFAVLAVTLGAAALLL